MNNFRIGDKVYASDWCYGEIVRIENGIADIKFDTCSGGGTVSFPIEELVKKKD